MKPLFWIAVAIAAVYLWDDYQNNENSIVSRVTGTLPSGIAAEPLEDQNSQYAG
jgi:hypothetical protein